MQVELVFGLPEERCRNVVVVDVFRSSTTIVAALENGAEEVIPVSSTEEAFRLRKELGGETLLVGEEMGITPEGFDLNISPRLMKKETVEGKKIIYRSTNLARVVSEFLNAENLVVGALTNSGAVARYVSGLGLDRVMVVACGLIPKKMITLEDVVGAGSIISKLDYDEASDAAIIAKLAYENKGWRKAVENGYIAKYLRELGWGQDIEYCLSEDISNVVPVLKNGVLKGVRV